jgi:hypothetical protein
MAATRISPETVQMELQETVMEVVVVAVAQLVVLAETAVPVQVA